MLKKVAGRKFSRNTNSRQAMFRSLVRNLLLNGSVVTTETKAKAVFPIVDGLFKKAKRGNLTDKRSIVASAGNDSELLNAISKYSEIISTKNSGFTKVTKLVTRRGDNAPMVRLELQEDTK